MRHLEERLGIEPHALGECQPLRQRHAVEPEDQIDRELGAAAVADLADVKAARKQRIEHRRASPRGLRIAADQADAVALAHLLARARHRRFEEADVRAREPPAQRLDPVGSQVEVQSTTVPGSTAGSSAFSVTSST